MAMLGKPQATLTRRKSTIRVGRDHQRGQDSLTLNEVGFVTRGRPLGPTVDCKFNRLTVDSTHSRSPKGHPLLGESRTDDSAARLVDPFDPASGVRNRPRGEQGENPGDTKTISPTTMRNPSPGLPSPHWETIPPVPTVQQPAAVRQPSTAPAWRRGLSSSPCHPSPAIAGGMDIGLREADR